MTCNNKDIKVIVPTKEERIQEAIDSIKLMSPDAYAAIYNKGRNDAIDECINQIPFLATDGEFNRCASYILYRLTQLKKGNNGKNND